MFQAHLSSWPDIFTLIFLKYELKLILLFYEINLTKIASIFFFISTLMLG